MIIFDTDLIIWVQRGNEKAAKIIEGAQERYLSIVSYMELLQCAKNKEQHIAIREFISQYSFQILALTENIGHRALIYVEEFSLSHNVRVSDAIIAATSIENNMLLITGNEKHFKPIRELRVKFFKPF